MSLQRWGSLGARTNLLFVPAGVYLYSSILVPPLRVHPYRDESAIPDEVRAGGGWLTMLRYHS